MNRFSLKMSRYRLFGIFVGVFFFLAAFKPWFDIYFGITNNIITGFQLILCLFVTSLFIIKELRFNVHLCTLVVFVLARLFSEFLYAYFEGRSMQELVGAVYSTLRLIMFCGLVLLVSQYKNFESVNNIRSIFLAYFFVTLLYSVLQHPMLGNFTLLHTAGGNIVSANGLGAFRANGGIGGTVIAYSNFLLAVGWVVFYGEFNNKYFHLFLKLCFFVSLFLCFSRSVFLCIFVMYLINIVVKKKVVSAFAISLITLVLAYYFADVISDNYALMISNSDTGRVGGWKAMLGGSSALEFLLGSQVGQNTGLFLGGLTKNEGGDSFLIGTVNDYGIIGAILFVFVFSKLVFSFNIQKYSTILGIVGSFIVMTFVNSGFEKLVVMLSYMLALIIINKPVGREDQIAIPKYIVSR